MFLTPDESQAQQAKLTQFIKERSDFNHQRYLSPKPGAKRAKKGSHAAATTAGPSSKVSSVRQSLQTQPAPDLKTISNKLENRLNTLKSDSDEQKKPAKPVAKQKVAEAIKLSRNKTQDRDDTDDFSAYSSIASLEQQIGHLSLQIHLLMIQAAGAKGKRYSRLQSKIIILQLQVSELNLELEKKKANKSKKDFF